jgi:ATP-binding cassette subfamily F protein 3
VADRLWLVKGGRVTAFEEDLEAYRKLLLSSDAPPKPAKPAPKPKKASRDEIQALRSELRKCEARVEKLEDMREKLAKKLANPDLYEKDKVGEMEVWQKKYAEVMDGLERAEALWMAAQDKLDRAQA